MKTLENPVPDPRGGATMRALRALALCLFVFGCLGTGVELMLLEHHEELWQRLPLWLLAAGLLLAVATVVMRGGRSLRSFQVAMIAFVVSGLVGIWLHYGVNVEFERERYPSLAGAALFEKAVQGATPALAPGSMIQLGLLGLIYTFRHPALRGRRSIDSGD